MEKQLKKWNRIVVIANLLLPLVWIFGRKIAFIFMFAPFLIDVFAVEVLLLTLVLTILAYRLLKKEQITYRIPSYQKWSVGILAVGTIVFLIYSFYVKEDLSGDILLFLSEIVMLSYPARLGYEEQDR